jgi:hypothetical protein
MTDNAPAAEVSLVVMPLDGADSDLVEIGRRYWALKDVEPDTGRIRWAEKSSDIAAHSDLGRPFVVAAASVRAMLPGRTCPDCGGALSLTSRSALERALAGEEPFCVECDQALKDNVASLMDSNRRQNARLRRARTAASQDVRRLQQLRQEAQIAVLHNDYAIKLLPDVDIPEAPVRTELATLALLRYAPQPAPISPLQDWPAPLYPRATRTGHVLGEVLRTGLICIHPDSPTNSIVWEPEAFDDAMAAINEADLNAEERIQHVVRAGNYYPLRAIHYTPFGHSFDTAAAVVRDEMSSRLDPAQLTDARQQQMQDLIVELLAEEALRYLAALLDEHNLPQVPENHWDKLVEAAYEVARHRPLSQLYNLAWRSARDAAAAAQRNPQAPAANMTAHAVNRFESYAQQALNPVYEIKPFGPKAGLELAAMTRTLFLRVLNRDPFATSLPDIGWPEPAPASRDDTDDDPRAATPATRTATEPSSASSDLGVLCCGVCGFPVQPADAWIWVDVHSAVTFLEHQKEARTFENYLEGLEQQPPRSCWGVGHSECGPDEGALHDVRLPASHRELLAWTADMLSHRWINGTDLAALLHEAADRSGRFTSDETRRN